MAELSQNRRDELKATLKELELRIDEKQQILSPKEYFNAFETILQFNDFPTTYEMLKANWLQLFIPEQISNLLGERIVIVAHQLSFKIESLNQRKHSDYRLTIIIKPVETTFFEYYPAQLSLKDIRRESIDCIYLKLHLGRQNDHPLSLYLQIRCEILKFIENGIIEVF